MNKAVIIGFDGGSWDILDLMMDKGYMPNLKGILQKGSYGGLKTTHPPTTAPAWSSFATGKNPGKHGVFDFLMPKGSLSNLVPVTSREIKTETFYELVARKGGRVVLINLPVSYPPRLKGDDHVVITSLMTPGEDFIFPPTLKEEFPELKEYRISPDPDKTVNGTEEEYAQEVRQLEAVRFECGRDIFNQKKWDLFFYLISGTDWIQHRLFEKLLNEELSVDHPAMEAYRDFDGYLGWFAQNLPENSYLFLISDHGFTVRKGFFYFNNWLRNNGYLAVTEQPHEEKSITRSAAEFKSAAKGINIQLPSFVTWALSKSPGLERGATRFWRLIRKRLQIRARWNLNTPILEESKAYLTQETSWALYLTSEMSDKAGSKYDDNIREDLIRKMASIKDTESGEPIFDWIAPREDVYKGPFLKNAPDILMASKSFQVKSIIPHKSTIFRRNRINGHSPVGIFAVYGAEIKRGKKIQNASILDIAPTILHFMGLPVISDMDGNVLKEVLAQKANTYQRPVSKTAAKWMRNEDIQMPSEEEEIVKKRLHDLGYL